MDVVILVFINTYPGLRVSLFLESTLRTSETNLRASNTGRRFNNAVSLGSLNQDFIGIALSKNKLKKLCFYLNIKLK